MTLDTELETYKQNREQLLATAEGKFALIRGDKIAGVYESKMDAISQGYRQFGNVPFLVKHVLRVEIPQNFVSGANLVFALAFLQEKRAIIKIAPTSLNRRNYPWAN